MLEKQMLEVRDQDLEEYQDIRILYGREEQWRDVS